jgi:aspartyl-tRNA(Asn)/glutamyl-tRNA(Gln) amidotransferase subunit C
LLQSFKLVYNSLVKINASHIAKLANLPITDAENTKFEKQLEETLKHVESLNGVDTKRIKPTSQVTGLENVSREDLVKPSLSQKKALSNTKSKHNGLFKVNAILEQ